MENGQKACNFSCVNLASISEPNDKFELTFNNIKRLPVHTLYYRLPFMVPLIMSVIHKQRKRLIKSSARDQIGIPGQYIRPGDLVEILSENEIRKTLDDKNKLKGLGFMPEMVKYSGKQFRVLKKVSRIKIESTGELRILKHPVFLLEGVYCDGEFHDNCERLCFLFWRTEWLRKV